MLIIKNRNEFVKKFGMFFLMICALSFGSQTIITIGDTQISDSLFFEKYPQEEWNSFDDSHKTRVIDDFLRRKVYAKEASQLNLQQDPDTRIKITNQKERLLVNFSYEEFVAKPLITDELITQTALFLKKDILVNHILIGYDGSRLDKKVDRTMDEAKNLAINVKQEYESGEIFETLAQRYSDDKSVSSNDGKLGWIEWGQTVHDFQIVAFSLDINELSDPVLTDYGYHLILVSDVRNTGFDENNPSSDNIIQQTARKCINSSLYKSAESYDDSMMISHGVMFNQKNLQLVFDDIEKAKKKNKITGNPNVDLQEAMSSIDSNMVLCVLDRKGFGAKWFAAKIAQSPMSRRPVITDLLSLQNAFRTIVLQEIGRRKALEAHLEVTPTFISMFDDYETAILYDVYRKYIDASIVDIDSSLVLQYYEDNKDQNYKEGQRVVICDLNVKTKSIADSLSALIKGGVDFLHLAQEFSQINPEEGGLLDPFTEGKYDVMGKKAFTMSIGEISEPFEKLNHSWSIIKLENKLPESYQGINKVYNKILSILLREQKAKAKDEIFDALKKKYHVTVNPVFFQYPITADSETE